MTRGGFLRRGDAAPARPRHRCDASRPCRGNCGRFRSNGSHARSYDAAPARRFWRNFVQVDACSAFPRRFLGKMQPVAFFLGQFRSGGDAFFRPRRAAASRRHLPTADGWRRRPTRTRSAAPASGRATAAIGKAAFYSYAYPEPKGFAQAPVEGAHYDSALGEFVLPYDAVAQSASPDATLLNFLQATYEAAAEYGTWDRVALERKT